MIEGKVLSRDEIREIWQIDRSESIEAVMLRLTGIDIRRCPVCHRGRMLVIEILPSPKLLDHHAHPWDTS